MSADLGRLAMLKRLLHKIRELLREAGELFSEARDVRYVSVPVWRPWRDF
jgi:hypothetical protein